jgi:hypothetical protein
MTDADTAWLDAADGAENDRVSDLFQGIGHTRSTVLLSIQLLSSALRNFISSRTTVNRCA